MTILVAFMLSEEADLSILHTVDYHYDKITRHKNTFIILCRHLRFTSLYDITHYIHVHLTVLSCRAASHT